MLLPPIQRTGEIHFHVAKGLAYPTRLALAFSLMATGLIAQGVWLAQGPWAAGLVPLLLGVLLLLPKGYSNAGGTGRATQDWRSARRQEVERILTINREQQRWDSDAFDITSGKGVLLLLFAGFVVAGAVGWLQRLHAPDRLQIMVVANAAVMLLPFWVSGVRFILKNDRLVVKTKLFINIEDVFNTGKGEDEVFGYQLQTAKALDEKGEVPRDVKAMVTFPKGPAEFLGMQMQIAINSVQGKDYPYFYCVLVGKGVTGQRMEDHIDAPPSGIVVEPSYKDEVYVVVIRQETTKNSGYHTNLKAAAKIFGYALKQARHIAR
jgi:hypothetical protein